MPILFCVALSLVLYFVLVKALSFNNRVSATNEDKYKVDVKYTSYEKCKQCNKDFQSNWRSCPYCGNTREKGDTIEGE